jgi:hypothetical protein
VLRLKDSWAAASGPQLVDRSQWTFRTFRTAAASGPSAISGPQPVDFDVSMRRAELRTVGQQPVSAYEVRSDEFAVARGVDASLSVARPYLGEKKVDERMRQLDISTQLAKESILHASLAWKALQQTKDELEMKTGGCKFKKKVAKVALKAVRDHVLWRTAGRKVGLQDVSHCRQPGKSAVDMPAGMRTASVRCRTPGPKC